MRVVPVLDLKQGHIVRGVAGRREAYRPIESALADSSSPADVARALADHFDFREAYVADLDAIGGQRANRRALTEIAASGMRLWVDAGLSNAAAVRQFAGGLTGELERATAGIIVGLESLAALSDLHSFSTLADPRLIFSLDLLRGEPLNRAADWAALSPVEIATAACESGFQRMIVLDLADVGVSGGTGTLALLRQLRRRAGVGELIAGGGVRGPMDLRRLADAGCDAALVASALHDGRLKKADLADWNSDPPWA